MADIKEAFELYDENGEGFISSRDAANVIRSFGFNPTEHELQVCLFRFINLVFVKIFPYLQPLQSKI